MGATPTGVWDGVPIITGDATTAGSIIGEASHALTTSELAQHDHSVYLHDPKHKHETILQRGAVSFSPTGAGSTAFNGSSDTSEESTGITLWSDGDNSGTQNKVGKTGSGTAHNNVQRTVLGTFYRKL
jgi:hypothetical protein